MCFKEKLSSALWTLLFAVLAVASILTMVDGFFGWIWEDREPPETEPPQSQRSEAFDILWYASEDIDFLSPGESWRTSDFAVTISDAIVDDRSGVRIDLKPSRLSLVDAFHDGTLQFYLYSRQGDTLEELLSGDDFLMYAALELMRDHHGRATLSIPEETDYLLVMVVADGSVYRATYTPD